MCNVALIFVCWILRWHWMVQSRSACPSSSSSHDIRYTPCLCLHMQQADREWLIRALCWTQARCSAEAVTYFALSLSDNHTGLHKGTGRQRGGSGMLSVVYVVAHAFHLDRAQPACLYKHHQSSVSCMTQRSTETSRAQAERTGMGAFFYYNIMKRYKMNEYFWFCKQHSEKQSPNDSDNIEKPNLQLAREYNVSNVIAW